jgi:hypothetical protein
MFRSSDVKKLELISDGDDSASKICRPCPGVSYGAAQRSLRLAEVWSQAFGFVLVLLQEPGLVSV